MDVGSALLYAGLAVALAVLTVLLLGNGASNSGPKPPGPPGLPIVGHLFDLGSGIDLHRKLLQWANTYGGIYSLNILGTPYVILSDPSFIYRVIGRSGLGLPKFGAIYNLSLEIASPKFESSLFTELTESPLWRAVRKGMSPCFSTENMKKVFPETNAIADKLTGIWADHISNQESTEILNPIKRAIIDVIYKAGFGVDFNSLEEIEKTGPYLEALHLALEDMNKGMADPFRSLKKKLFPFLPEFVEIRRSYAAVWDQHYSVLQLLKSRTYEDDDMSIGAALTRLKDPETGELFSDDKLLPNIAALFVAGFDTSSATACWALYDIATNPGVQQRVKNELEASNLIHKEGAPAPKPVEWADLTSLSYFNAVLQESMRLHPVAALGTIREVQEAVEVGKYVLLPKTVVWVPFLATHVSQQNFEKADQFIPERWMDGSSEIEGSAGLSNKAAFLPFSDGARNCIAQNMGWMMSRTILLSLLCRFWFDVDESKMGPKEDMERTTEMALVMMPKAGFHMTMRPHT